VSGGNHDFHPHRTASLKNELTGTAKLSLENLEDLDSADPASKVLKLPIN
jgi:hypothetical protein